MKDSFNMIIQTAALPETVKALTVKNDDGSVKVYVNDIFTEDEQAASFLHEMLHLWNHDFEKELSADEIEALTHRQLSRISEIYKNEERSLRQAQRAKHPSVNSGRSTTQGASLRPQDERESSLL